VTELSPDYCRGLELKTAFARWVSAPDEPDLSRLIEASLEELKAVIAGE